MNTPTTSARIFLVRHGETDWITGGKFASRTDVPLSRMGERDVELIRQRLVAEDELIDPTGIAKMYSLQPEPWKYYPILPTPWTTHHLKRKKKEGINKDYCHPQILLPPHQRAPHSRNPQTRHSKSPPFSGQTDG
jgi:hypothetical protein